MGQRNGNPTIIKKFIFWSIAQLVEQTTHIRYVTGSIPVRPIHLMSMVLSLSDDNCCLCSKMAIVQPLAR